MFYRWRDLPPSLTLLLLLLLSSTSRVEKHLMFNVFYSDRSDAIWLAKCSAWGRLGWGGALVGGSNSSVKRKRTRARNKDKWLRRRILIGQVVTGALAGKTVNVGMPWISKHCQMPKKGCKKKKVTSRWNDIELLRKEPRVAEDCRSNQLVCDW